ncbi:MAG: ral secretion pathway protein [Sphingomonadales bacterium]|jgi:general secretion pathway protein H|nr:ral secretion pathway protein [Sphingomonadales bacterium]
MRRGGFTLIELMVVLVIIGLAAAMVVLAIPERGGSLVSEAERFAARAKAARDGAILDSRAATIAVGPGGYEIGAAHYDWVEGTRGELSGGRDGRLRFTPTGLADPAQLVLRRGERTAAVRIGEDGNVQIQR